MAKKYYTGNYASKTSANEKAAALRKQGWDAKVKPYGEGRWVMYAKKDVRGPAKAPKKAARKAKA